MMISPFAVRSILRVTVDPAKIEKLVLAPVHRSRRQSNFLLACTLFPLPCTLYPVPSTLYPLPCTLYPVPSTLYPVPSTLFPLPSTLFATVYSAGVWRRRCAMPISGSYRFPLP